MSNKKRKTVDYKLIMTFEPCEDWPFDRVKKAVPKRIKLSEFLKNEKIPPKDKVWVALHKELACDIAERSLTRHRVTDDRSWNAIKVSRNFANGKATKEELAAALSAVVDAAWYTAAAARSAAGVARSAARSTAWAAAGVAGAAAAYAADAGVANEYKWVCEKLIEMLEKGEQ
jgi:hypothetical protein